MAEVSTDALRIIGIAGSPRKGSFNGMLLEAARGLTPNHVRIERFDIGGIPLSTPISTRRNGAPTPCGASRPRSPTPMAC